jgi:hypothetical protein
MKDFECTRLRARLGGDVLRFAGASAIGELVVVHAEQEPRPEIYRALELGLDRLEDAPEELVPAACLSGLWQIVALGPLARAQVRDLGAGHLSASLSHTRQHLGLVSDFVTFHIAHRPLKSLRFLADMLPAGEEV